ncbi:ROK family transcriptional regulator [Streptomyces sp. NA04227]|uniref:ROK family transcriptional regulator n=1 Tax=Streptomyces sp. NA04227 TaxID=2742136 RepID=UPI0015908E8E|nr:ROK family transcriptional regulator [Streptomyces sp. NA04227]QKW05045.1 ROK family transcriptional regulator [Streptomyces sp. NA04227]
MAGRPMSTPGSSAGEVFRLIHQQQAATRTDIGRITGLSRTAVTLRVNQLLEQGLVAERAEGGSTGGRPPVRLEFRVDGGIVLAAALGASRAQLAVCDLAGRVLRESELPVDNSRGPEALLTSAVDSLQELLAATGHTGHEIRGVGVSVPGMIDATTGRSVSPSLQPGWGDIPVAEFFTRRFAVPVRVDNDVNALALAEHRVHPEVDDLLVIKASTGIGAAIIAGGRLQRGALSAAGELGHIKVSDAGGAACRCGSSDCLEAVAGGWALVRELADAGRPVADALGVAELARDGDPEALRLIREAGRRIGEVTAGAVNLLNPALIVIGGDLAQAYEPLVAGIRELIYQRSTTAVTRSLRFESSSQHEHSGVAASAAMVLEEVLSARAVDATIGGRGRAAH